MTFVVIDVTPTAESADPTRLGGSTVLVIDVLRASTTIVAALGHGCVAVVPVADPAEARRRAAALPRGTALIAGERRGDTIPGFDVGNSPLELGGDRVRDKTVIFTTSNGTRALLVARGAAAVGVAALVNLSAAAAWALGQGRDVTLLCAGQRGAVSLEDQVCAGLLVDRLLQGAPQARPTAAAEAAARLGRSYGTEVARLGQDSAWARRLSQTGRDADVVACLRLDTTTLVPVYLADVDKVVAGSR